MIQTKDVITSLKETFNEEKDIMDWVKGKLFQDWLSSLSESISVFDELLESAAKTLCINGSTVSRYRAHKSVAAIAEYLSTYYEALPNISKHFLQKRFHFESSAHQILKNRMISNFLQQDVKFLEVPVGLKPGKECKVSLPARVSMAGGWSDTPPFCMENGGKMINMAVTLDDKLPISAIVRVLTSPVIRLSSVDLDMKQEISTLQDLFQYTHIRSDSLVIHQAVIMFWLFRPLNLFVDYNDYLQSLTNNEKPLDLKEKLKEMFNGHDYGLELETHVDIPVGTGLGASSILILACVRALMKLTDEINNLNYETNSVLTIEQMISTGGGWQDQIGGGTPGLKKITAGACNDTCFPMYTVTPFELDEEHLQVFHDRIVFFYTGKQRVAKTVLGSVVKNWNLRLGSSKETLLGIRDVPDEIDIFFTEFLKESIKENESKAMDAAGVSLNKAKNLCIKLDESFTSQAIDDMFVLVDPFLAGSNLIGAGAGGFIVGILKSGVSKEEYSQFLQKHNLSLTNIKLYR